MFENKDIRREAVVIVATYLFILLIDRFELVDTTLNTIRDGMGDDPISILLGLVGILIGIPLLLFTIAYFFIGWLDDIVEMAKRKRNLH